MLLVWHHENIDNVEYMIANEVYFNYQKKKRKEFTQNSKDSRMHNKPDDADEPNQIPSSSWYLTVHLRHYDD
jgi:hypothetical protein